MKNAEVPNYDALLLKVWTICKLDRYCHNMHNTLRVSIIIGYSPVDLDNLWISTIIRVNPLQCTVVLKRNKIQRMNTTHWLYQHRYWSVCHNVLIGWHLSTSVHGQSSPINKPSHTDVAALNHIRDISFGYKVVQIGNKLDK